MDRQSSGLKHTAIADSILDRNSRRAQDAVLSFVEEHGLTGATCAYERPITHLPTSAALH
jgi:hypothetical protein